MVVLRRLTENLLALFPSTIEEYTFDSGRRIYAYVSKRLSAEALTSRLEFTSSYGVTINITSQSGAIGFNIRGRRGIGDQSTLPTQHTVQSFFLFKRILTI